jgi:Tfp pilus assembly protein PilF
MPEDARELLENTLASDELVKLAQKRIEEGELRQAASTCIKAIGMYPQNIDAWITFAQANVDYGDFKLAEILLEGAIEVMDNLGLRRDADPWCRRIAEVQRQINQSKSHGRGGSR